MKTNVTGLDWMTKKEKEPAGMPAASSVSAEPKLEAPKPAPVPVAEAPKMDAVPAPKPAPMAPAMPVAEAKPERTSADPEVQKVIDYENKVNAYAKNMKKALANPEFAKLAGISEEEMDDFKDVYYEKGGFDEEDYNEVVNDYKNIGMSPQSFRKEVIHYPGIDVALNSALGQDNVKALLKDIGIEEDALSDTKVLSEDPEDDGGFHDAVNYLLEYLYENGTPEQFSKFGKQLKSAAFKLAAASKK